MKCPKCGKEGYKFADERKKGAKSSSGNTRWSERKTNKTICKKCGYEGEEAWK